MARRRTAVRSVAVGYGALIAAQTSPAAVSRVARKLLKSPERLAAYMRSNPDPVMFAAIAGQRAVSNLCGVHTLDRSPATPLEGYAAKVARAHLQLCRTDPALAAKREARWAGQRRLLRSGFLRPFVDAAAQTYGTACRGLIDSAEGRRVYAVPARGWQPVGVMSGVRVPTFDVARRAAVLEQPAVLGMPQIALRGSGRLRRRLMIAKGPARAEQLLQRSRIRVPLSALVFKMRLKRALRRGPDSTQRFLQRAANNPRRAAAAVRAGLDPLVIAAAVGPAQVEKVLRGGSFEHNTPLARLGKALVEERARLHPGSARRAENGPTRFDSDLEYGESRDRFVAGVMGLRSNPEGPALVSAAWRANQGAASSGTPEASVARGKVVDVLVAQRPEGLDSTEGDLWEGRPYETGGDGPGAVPEPGIPDGGDREWEQFDREQREREQRERNDREERRPEDRGGDGDRRDGDSLEPHDGPDRRDGSPPDPTSDRSRIPPEWREFDLDTGHKVVTFSRDLPELAEHLDRSRGTFVTDAVLVSVSDPPPGRYQVAGDLAEKFASVQCIPGRQDVAPAFSLVVREGVVLDEADKKAAFDLVSLASTMERDRALYPDGGELGEWRPPLADAEEKGIAFSPEELEQLRRNRPGIIQRFCDAWDADDIDIPQMSPDGRGGFTVFGDDEVAAIRPTPDGGWKIVFHPHVQVSATGLPENSGGPAFVVEADKTRFDRAETVSQERVFDVRFDEIVSGRSPHEMPFAADGKGFSADSAGALRAWAQAHPDEMEKCPPQFVTRAQAAASGYTVDDDAKGVRVSMTRMVGDPPAELTSDVVVHHVGSELKRLTGTPAEAPLRSKQRDPAAASVQPADLRSAYKAATGQEPAKVKGPDAAALQNGQMLCGIGAADYPAEDRDRHMVAIRAVALDTADRLGVRVAFPPPSAEDRGKWSERFRGADGAGRLEDVPVAAALVVEKIVEARESRNRGHER